MRSYEECEKAAASQLSHKGNLIDIGRVGGKSRSDQTKAPAHVCCNQERADCLCLHVLHDQQCYPRLIAMWREAIVHDKRVHPLIMCRRISKMVISRTQCANSCIARELPHVLLVLSCLAVPDQRQSLRSPTPALHPRTPSLFLPHPHLHVTQMSHALTKLFLLSCFKHQTYKHITRAIRLWQLCPCQARRNPEPHVQYEHAFAFSERSGPACPHIDYSRLILCDLAHSS